MLLPVAIIADDLTGAADTAAAFARPGRPVPVSLSERPVMVEGAAAFAVTTESRACPPQRAYDVVLRAAQAALAAGAGLLYKKVDSNLRGNIGAELAALIDATGQPILLAPAFPARGRTVVDGIARIDGVPIAETEMARDAEAPVLLSDIADIIHSQRPDLTVSRLPLDVVRAGLPDLASFLSKSAILVADAETDGDLDALAAAALALDAPPLLAGSAGFARALASCMFSKADMTEVHPARGGPQETPRKTPKPTRSCTHIARVDPASSAPNSPPNGGQETSLSTHIARVDPTSTARNASIPQPNGGQEPSSSQHIARVDPTSSTPNARPKGGQEASPGAPIPRVHPPSGARNPRVDPPSGPRNPCASPSSAARNARISPSNRAQDPSLSGVLAVLASSSGTLLDQVSAAREQHIVVITVQCEGFSWAEDSVPELAAAITRASADVRAGRDVIVYAVGDLPQVERPVDLIVEHLAHLAFVVVRQAHPSALIVGGGSTAYAVLATLGVESLQIDAEPLPGIAAGVAVGGHFDGRPLVLKPGAAGDRTALVALIRYLRRRRAPEEQET